MNTYVHFFQEIDKDSLSVVGGKGANLGALSKINGINIAEGFCITTDAYKKTFYNNENLNALIHQLSNLKANDRDSISNISSQIRKIIQGQKIPNDIVEEVIINLKKLGEDNAFAIRSSATAEDLPTTSFAGQHDTFLNIIGMDAIIKHISKCWASLFTDRAVTYRIQNDFEHDKVYLSVIVQRMVIPDVSGIMFTVDPISSNKNLLTIDASFGLGEALVSGLVTADLYSVQKGNIVEKKIATKECGIYPLEEGGIEKREIKPQQKIKQALSDEEILQLESIGRKIETYYNCPQDIEWCKSEGQFVIIQSRPITTLYPIPKTDDEKNHAYISAGHMQMMTDAFKPLGMCFFNVVAGNLPSCEVGGRLFLDVTHDLASPFGRQMALFSLKMVGDKLMTNAVVKLAKDKQYIKSLPKGKEKVFKPSSNEFSFSIFTHYFKILRKNDPQIIKDIISRDEKVIEDLKSEIENLSGDELFDFISDNLKHIKKVVIHPQSIGALMVAIHAVNWVNKKMKKWLGDKNIADTLTQSVPNSITANIGFDLLNVSDVVRQYPDVMDYFNHAVNDTFYKDLEKLEGGLLVSKAIKTYLDKYGMRCSGDIDITRARWIEEPTVLIPTILSNIKNFPPNACKLKYKQGLEEAAQKEQALLHRVKLLSGGKQKAKKTKKMISIMRNYIGFREYPKHAFVHRYLIYKKALLKQANILVQEGIIKEKEDINYLYYAELKKVLKTKRLDYSIIEKRKKDFKHYEKLTPPRVMTTEDGIISGAYITGDISKNALQGIPVSAGIIEGRARVILKMEDAKIEDGDILVTDFTDPSWTPVFVSLKGLITEVGGLMTHGAVIAREYGLPAVVSVVNATKHIKDGDMIRVNGTEGYVEILP